MSTEHSPEPWVIESKPTDIWSTRGGLIAKVHAPLEPDVAWEEGVANADRIVACVNACAGLSNDILEKIVAHGAQLGTTEGSLLETWQRYHNYPKLQTAALAVVVSYRQCKISPSPTSDGVSGELDALAAAVEGDFGIAGDACEHRDRLLAVLGPLLALAEKLEMAINDECGDRRTIAEVEAAGDLPSELLNARAAIEDVADAV